MKLTRTYCLICICLCAGYSTKAADEISFRTADSLKMLGEYQFAAIEYERIYFSSEEISSRTFALLQKAECLKARNEFELAEKCLMRINYFGLTDTLAYTARHQTALCAYLAEHFTNAESQLLQMLFMIKDTSLIIPSLPLYVLVLNELQKWDEAKAKLFEWVKKSELPKNLKDSLSGNFELLYDKKNHPVLKKKAKARTLSSIIPGSGQIYAGYFWEGVANASLQGTALLLTAYGIYTGYYVTSVIVPFGLFQKFYSGALVRVEFLVDKKNYELVRAYNDKLKMEILSFHKINR